MNLEEIKLFLPAISHNTPMSTFDLNTFTFDTLNKMPIEALLCELAHIGISTTLDLQRSWHSLPYKIKLVLANRNLLKAPLLFYVADYQSDYRPVYTPFSDIPIDNRRDIDILEKRIHMLKRATTI